MLHTYIIDTANQKVLSFLAKFSDQEYYEREIARKVSISYGSANHALNNLYSTGAVKRRQEGKMYFYSVDLSNPAIREFKKLTSILLAEPLTENLKALALKVVLYGSCSQGTDTSRSDLDLFVVSDHKEQVMEAVERFTFPPGFESIEIQPVVKSPVELLQTEESQQAFLSEVDQGIVLWERVSNEPGL
jgi:DNA-binding transcriptional ArsR family regulator